MWSEGGLFIDIHAHAYRRAAPWPVRFATPEEVLSRYDAMGIDRGVLLPIVSPEVYLPQTNEEILEMVERYPDRFVPFCNIDPRAVMNAADAPLGDLLRYYRDRGCRGLGEVMPNLAVGDPLVQNLFRHAADVGFPVIYDGTDRLGGDFGLYDDPGLPQLQRTLQRFPDLIILGHGPVFWAEMGPVEIWPAPGKRVMRWFSSPIREEGVVPRMMRRFPNLYGDLSDANPWHVLSGDPDYGARFLTEFQDRLFFGTDICFADMPVPMVDLLQDWRAEGTISEAVFEKVARGNAQRLLML